MDKKIFFAAFLALILEVLWLLADMGVLNIPGITQVTSRVGREAIGSVEERRHTLKRKHLDSIVWEETHAKDSLYYLDSVLTLDQSSATLRLTGDTQLTLSENTLVVLEPSSDSKSDQIRVRFSRGDIRSRNPDKNLAVQTSSWTVEVEKGSEINLRTKDSENLELEVSKGKVKVKEASQETPVEFQTGDVVKMHHSEIHHQKIDNNLVWKTPIENLNLVRKYSHQFPVSLRLEWQGEATELSWEDPKGKVSKFELPQGSQSYEVLVERGLHHFRIGDGTSTSPILPVEIWQAPEIHTFWPLPRDRYTTGREITFSWSEVEGISDYQLNIENESQNNYVRTVKHRSTLSDTPPIEGEYHWSVEAFDSYGFQIPHYYRSPIYFLKNPLAPPVLREPEILDDSRPPLRSPADENPKRSSWFLNIFFHEARADVKGQQGYKALFKWERVEGADHYLIEIDDEPNFKTPLVQQKVSLPEFIWSDFKLSTYYWRVAAEGKKGEKGLFSPVTTVDLSNPKALIPPSAETPKVAAPNPIVEKHEKPKPTALKAPEQKPENISKKKVTPVQPEPPREEKEPEFLSKERFDDGGRPIKGHVYWTPIYESSSGAGEDISTSFSGFQVLSLDSRLDFPIDANDSDLTVRLSYRSGTYKALPEADFPFQEKIKRGNLRGSLLYGPSREFKYGLRTSTFEIIKRKSYEQVQSEDSLAYGPGIYWPIMEDLELEAAILFGGSSLLGESQIRYTSAFPALGSINFRWGAELEFRIVNSSVYRESQVLPKMIFGLSW